LEVLFYMVKLSNSNKLDAVLRYIDGKESYQDISSSLGVDDGDLRLWVKRYEYHGIEAFTKSYTKYTAEYKLDVLNYMNLNGTSIRETTAIFNLPNTTMIPGWRKLLESGGIDALIPKKKGRPFMMKDKLSKSMKQTPVEGSVEALQAEIERLRMENAYLKKLNALVQNKEKSPNKTKHK
jgi:transposase